MHQILERRKWEKQKPLHQKFVTKVCSGLTYYRLELKCTQRKII